MVMLVMTGQASFYSSKDACKYNHNSNCPTSSGIGLIYAEKHLRYFSASWYYELGTTLTVCRKDDPAKCIQVINIDRGPNKRYRTRIIDLSRVAFKELANPKTGLTEVTVSDE